MHKGSVSVPYYTSNTWHEEGMHAQVMQRLYKWIQLTPMYTIEIGRGGVHPMCEKERTSFSLLHFEGTSRGQGVSSRSCQNKVVRIWSNLSWIDQTLA